MRRRIFRFMTKGLYFLEALFLNNDRLCPYCGGDGHDVVFKKAVVVKICRCRRCGLLWTNPIFRFPGFYDLLYESGFVTELSGKERLNELTATDFKNSERDYSRVVDRLSSMAGGRDLLEFGSSWGYFLYQAKKSGFSAKGVEVSRKRRDYGIENLGLDIVRDIGELISGKKKFDLIVTFHTLEHLTSLAGIFRDFHCLLKDGGILVIDVPFIDTGKGPEAFKIMGAVHPLGFDRDFFIRNLPQEGFSVDMRDGLVICRKI